MNITSLNTTSLHDGFKTRITFSNGYGASVVSHEYSYGGEVGLLEVAVLDNNGEITYTTPIASDVIGYLTGEETAEILNRISELPPII